MGPGCAIPEAVWGMKAGRKMAVFGVCAAAGQSSGYPTVYTFSE